MHEGFEDILALAPNTAPLWWWDERAAVPRFAPFRPDMCDVYADLAALLVVRCQACGREFDVSVHRRLREYSLARKVFVDAALPTAVDAGDFDAWGDPPTHGCAGDTMMSELARVKEFWERGAECAWRRRSDLEFTYAL